MLLSSTQPAGLHHWITVQLVAVGLEARLEPALWQVLSTANLERRISFSRLPVDTGRTRRTTMLVLTVPRTVSTVLARSEPTFERFDPVDPGQP